MADEKNQTPPPQAPPIRQVRDDSGKIVNATTPPKTTK
jgi:hypothetical protein